MVVHSHPDLQLSCEVALDVLDTVHRLGVQMAKGCGMAGIVVDGPATDKLALEKSGSLVFCTGFSPVTSMVTGTSGEVGYR
ncbi:MAG: hypothetical protein HFF55_04655 [Lawsonibacter sp.]|nr:hypothetical protein [Lawsonibacter sp.]MCI9567025.1 hypothetical protein [Lawsonibacter sp.]